MKMVEDGSVVKICRSLRQSPPWHENFGAGSVDKKCRFLMQRPP
jgi:hypothetical protein